MPMVSPAASTPGISRKPGAWRAASTPAPSGSTPTSSSRFQRRSAAPRKAASAVRRAATASAPGWHKNRFMLTLVTGRIPGRRSRCEEGEMSDIAEMTTRTSSSAPSVAVPVSLQVRVRAMRWEASGVMSLELSAVDGALLPPFEPGAHVDLRLPDGTLRQYSLCGDPSDRSHYRLGIRAVGGGLSSTFVHRKLRPGELVTVSAPRNNFPLEDAQRYIFVAGGIGVTPLIPMMRQAS